MKDKSRIGVNDAISTDKHAFFHRREGVMQCLTASTFQLQYGYFLLQGVVYQTARTVPNVPMGIAATVVQVSMVTDVNSVSGTLVQ